MSFFFYVWTVLIIVFISSIILTALVYGLLRVEKKKEIRDKEERLRVRKLERLNRLYQCQHDACLKMMRTWQREWQVNTKEKDICVHCERRIVLFYTGPNKEDTITGLREIHFDDNWMDTHPDCFKITQESVELQNKMLKQIAVNAEEIKTIERFEVYNGLKIDYKILQNEQHMNNDKVL